MHEGLLGTIDCILLGHGPRLLCSRGKAKQGSGSEPCLMSGYIQSIVVGHNAFRVIR